MLEYYFHLCKKSWDNFIKNSVLFIPYILELFVSLFLLLMIIGAEIGLFYLLLGSLKNIESEIFKHPLTVILFILLALIDVFVLIAITSFFRAMKIGMYKEVITRRKTTVSYMYYFGKKFFKRKFEVSLIAYLIFLLPLLLLAVIAGFFLLLYNPVGMVIGIVLGAVYGLYFVIMGIIVYFGLFFIDPIIVSQEKSAIDLMAHSFKFMRENLSKVIITWAFIACFSLIIGFVLYIIELPFDLFNFPQYKLLILILLFLAEFIAKTTVNIIIDLFFFNVYFKS